jgi:hypothetical protein
VTGAALLAQAYAAGAVLTVADGCVVVDGASRLAPGLLADLRAHKADLLALLDRHRGERTVLVPGRRNGGSVSRCPIRSMLELRRRGVVARVGSFRWSWSLAVRAMSTTRPGPMARRVCLCVTEVQT